MTLKVWRRPGAQHRITSADDCYYQVVKINHIPQSLQQHQFTACFPKNKIKLDEVAQDHVPTVHLHIATMCFNNQTNTHLAVFEATTLC